MPNHVCNRLELSGKQEDIDRLLNHIKGSDSAFDFNTIIPMPKTLDIESGSRTRFGLDAAEYLATGVITKGSSWLLDWRRQEAPSLSLEQFIDVLVKERRCDLNLGEVARNNVWDYGYPTWYEWCCDNWGTKWNAYSIDITGNTMIFETAWSSPEPVIDKLAELFPAVRITHHWADESIGDNCGHIVYCDGRKVTDFVIPDSSQVYEIYTLCWGESECLERDEFGNVSRKECETCVGCN